MIMADAGGPLVDRRPRRAWLAFLLSLLFPGLGHIYATSVACGCRWAVLATALGAGAFAGMMLPPASPLLVGAVLLAVGALLLTQLLSAIDAWRVSRRIRAAALPRWRWLAYLGLPLVSFGMPEALAPLSVWHNYSIPSSSMLPGIQVGDVLVAWRGYFAGAAPRHGDLAVFDPPDTTMGAQIKRIVGLPGDRVQMREGRLLINDRLVPRDEPRPFLYTGGSGGAEVRTTLYRETLPGMTHDILELNDHSMLDDTPVHAVPAGHVFVMGDNRDNSMDSRVPRVGFVPIVALRDRPMLVLWASDWRRIGKRLD